MPRRATSTSYGGKQGNKPKGKDQKRPGPGAPPKMFNDRLKLILERDRTIKNIETILDNPDHPKFDKMLDYATERVHGKVPQPTEQKVEGDITIRVVRDDQ